MTVKFWAWVRGQETSAWALMRHRQCTWGRVHDSRKNMCVAHESNNGHRRRKGLLSGPADSSGQNNTPKGCLDNIHSGRYRNVARKRRDVCDFSSAAIHDKRNDIHYKQSSTVAHSLTVHEAWGLAGNRAQRSTLFNLSDAAVAVCESGPLATSGAAACATASLPKRRSTRAMIRNTMETTRSSQSFGMKSQYIINT